MVAWIWRIMIVVMILVSVNDSEARRDVLSSEQKGELAKIQRLLVEVIAITDQGPADPGALTKTVERRMQVLGYTVVTDPQQPHDAVLRVKCEEHKAWEGTTQSGGDADLPDLLPRVERSSMSVDLSSSWEKDGVA